MRLVLLGTSGYHPSEKRHTACLAIPECGVALDAGTGMFRLGRYLATDELDLFLTHAHLDHVVGLTYFFSVLYEHPLRRITVHGEEAKLAAIQEHLLAEALFPGRPPLEFRPLPREVGLPQGGKLTSFPVSHVGGALGFRLDWPGHSVAYVTDTTAAPDAAYLEEIRGAQLLIHECYYPDSAAEFAERFGHSTTSAVADLARRAEVGRVLLTHIHPLAPDGENLDLPAARKIFSPLELAEDLMEVEF
ncbi:MAG: MBL fold metallo-hydrolase [Pirellulales bacterium]|nr:MBL fold metallo-hydrolase [Pirellulales bacterium]